MDQRCERHPRRGFLSPGQQRRLGCVQTELRLPQKQVAIRTRAFGVGRGAIKPSEMFPAALPPPDCEATGEVGLGIPQHWSRAETPPNGPTKQRCFSSYGAGLLLKAGGYSSWQCLAATGPLKCQSGGKEHFLLLFSFFFFLLSARWCNPRKSHQLSTFSLRACPRVGPRVQ